MRHTRSLVSTLLLACTVSVVAQTNTSGLSGTILDPSGALVPGATVTLTNSASGFNRSVVAKSKGEYSFDQIPPGDYLVTITSPGFAPQIKRVELLVATPLKLDFKLTVGNAEVVDVAATSAAVNTVDASLGKPFNSTTIENLPYLANNVLSLLSLQAGVISYGPGSTSVANGVINGARNDQTNISLDGVDNNDQNAGTPFQGVLRSTRESVEEFRVTTTNANADAGRSSGAQVSLQTRSGTNNIHGTAYEYYRDPAAAANDWFNKQSQLNSSLRNVSAKVLQNTYGASLGFPIIKDKLFFFGAYEGFRQASNQVVTQSVPTTLGVSPAILQGSDAQAPQALVVNGVAYGGLRTGTVSYIDSRTTAATLKNNQTFYSTVTTPNIATMDPLCLGLNLCTKPGVNDAILAYYAQFPLANAVGGDGYNTGGYTFVSPRPINQITNIARIDYTISSHQILFVRANLQSDNQTSALTFPNTIAGSRTFGNSRGIAAGHIWNISSSLTNNLRFGFVRQGSSVAGTGNVPYVSVGGPTQIAATTVSSAYTEPLYNIADDFTIVKGRHTIQFGANNRYIFNNRSNGNLVSNATTSVAQLTNAAVAGTGLSFDPGHFGFNPVYSSGRSAYNTAILSIVGGITASNHYVGYHLANNTLTPILGGFVPTRNFRANEQEYYVQDQWKVTPRLTLTAGVRYVYLGTPYETNGQEIAPSISMDTFLANRLAGAASGTSYNTPLYFRAAGAMNGQPGFWSPQKLDFAPRFAFAWASSDNKTSIRGGYALAFDHFGDALIDNYDSATGGSSLSLRGTVTKTPYGTSDTLPRFTGYNNVPPVVSTIGQIALPTLAVGTSFSFLSTLSDKQPTPYGETVNLTVQHEVKHGLTLTASYVGRFGRHLLTSTDAAQPNNLYDPTSGQTYFQAIRPLRMLADANTPVSQIQDTGYFHNIFPHATYTVGSGATAITYTGARAFYLRLLNADLGNETDALYQYDVAAPSESVNHRFFYPQAGSLFLLQGTGTSNYNSGQATLRHVVNRTFQYDLNYTFAKSMDLGSSSENSSAAPNTIYDTTNPSGNYGPSDFDVRHLVTADYVITLPFGHGQRFLNHTNGLVDRVIGGWTVTGIVHYSTALPFGIASNAGYGTNFSLGTRAVPLVPYSQVGFGGHHYVPSGTASYETAFNGLTGAQAGALFRNQYPGEAAPRNEFRGDAYLDLDNGVGKSFRTYHEQSFTIKAEAFNVLNDARFGNPNTTFQSANFGKYLGSTQTSPRQMQFSGKYTF